MRIRGCVNCFITLLTTNSQTYGNWFLRYNSGEKQSCSQPNILLKSVQTRASVSCSLERLRGSCLYRWTRLVKLTRITLARRTSEPSPGTAGAQRTASHVCLSESGFRRAPRRDNRSMGSPRRALSCRACAMHARLPPAPQARPRMVGIRPLLTDSGLRTNF